MSKTSGWEAWKAHYREFVKLAGGKAGVYRIDNLRTGRVYIGQSFNILYRIQEHISHLSKDVHHSKAMQADYDRYDLESFRFSILRLESDLAKRYQLEADLTRQVPLETLYSPWEALDLDGRRKLCGAKLTAEDAAVIRAVASSVSEMTYAELTELAGQLAGQSMNSGSVWSIVQNQTYVDPCYTVPPSRLPLARAV